MKTKEMDKKEIRQFVKGWCELQLQMIDYFIALRELNNLLEKNK